MSEPCLHSFQTMYETKICKPAQGKEDAAVNDHAQTYKGFGMQVYDIS